jgi:DNA-binding transcriptional LysR family regulator
MAAVALANWSSMDLRQLRYFRAVVESGSFVAAAASLHMSQPPLSLAISKLEKELGVKLLIRTARGVQPTSAGMYLLNAGSRILGDVGEVVEHLTRHGAGQEGSLSIAAVPALMWRRIPELLREHGAENPDVEVRLVDPPPWIAIEMVEDRKVDVAFILVANADQFAERQQRFHVRRWEDVPLMAAFPPYRADLPDPVGISVFEGTTMILPQRTLAVPSLPDVVDEALARFGVLPHRTRVSETIQTSLPMIAAGQACSILPDAQGRSLTGFDIVVRHVREHLPALHAVAVMSARAESSPAVRRLLRRVQPHKAGSPA